MASSNEKVVYAFQIFEKRLVLYIFNKKPEKKMFANTASLIIQIKIVFRDSLLGKLCMTSVRHFRKSMFIKFILSVTEVYPPTQQRYMTLNKLKIDL